VPRLLLGSDGEGVMEPIAMLKEIFDRYVSENTKKVVTKNILDGNSEELTELHICAIFADILVRVKNIEESLCTKQKSTMTSETSGTPTK